MRLIIFLLVVCPLSINAQNCLNWQTPTGNDWQTPTGETWQVEKNDCPKITPSVVTLFPNPATDFIQVSGLESDNTEGAILNNIGQLQYRLQIISNVDLKSNLLDISHLSQGIYFLKIKNRVLKFIKI